MLWVIGSGFVLAFWLLALALVGLWHKRVWVRDWHAIQQQRACYRDTKLLKDWNTYAAKRFLDNARWWRRWRGLAWILFTAVLVWSGVVLWLTTRGS